MSSSSVSIALCTYNGEKYLQAQLDSLLAQTRLPRQIVVRDDVSGDGTWGMLEAFGKVAAQKNVRVELHRNASNLGYVRNFSAALQDCDGDVVFLCDQDDVWHREKIERMCAEFERRPELGLLHTDARLVDADGRDLRLGLFEVLEMQAWEIEAEHRGDGFDVLSRRNAVTGATLALRREYLAKLLPVLDGWIHDEWLAFGIAAQAQVDCLEWKSIDYRQHGGNQIGARKRSNAEKLVESGGGKRAFMGKVATRLEQALQYLHDAGLPPPAEKAAQLRERIEHARFRQNLPTALLPRLRSVRAEAKSGRYQRYSSGFRSIVSDIVDFN